MPSSDISTARRGAAVDLGGDTALVGCRGLYIGVAGDLKVDLVDGGVGLVFKSHPAGYFLGQPTKVYSTANGTSATDIIALY